MALGKDRFNIPFFQPSKVNGFFWQMEDNPKSSKYADWPSEMSFDGGGIMTMSPNGATDFGIGKNIADFQDSIGGCKMDFDKIAAQGYAYKKDDARDIEYKALVKFDGIDSDSGFSISVCTGHHDSGSSVCCQGFAYMFTTEVTMNPSTFRFRKEEWHVHYTNAPDTGNSDGWKHSKCDFKISGCGKYVGLGIARYNKRKDPTKDGPDDSVILEIYFNPDPAADLNNWTMLRRTEDKDGFGWGDACDDCGSKKSQVGVWSNAQNRMKTNSKNGTVKFKCVTFREIDPFSYYGVADSGPTNPPACKPPNMSSLTGHKDCPKGQFMINGACRTLQEAINIKMEETNPGLGCRAPVVPANLSHGSCSKPKLMYNGVCHTIQEIVDSLMPTTSTNPPPPSSTGTITATFRDIYNINSSAAQSCSGLQAGVVPLTLVYDEHSGTSTRALHDDIADSYRVRVAEKINSTNSVLFGKKPRQVVIPLAKFGSPGGNMKCAIWDNTGSEVAVIGTMAVNSLVPSFVEQTFYNEAVPALLPTGMKLDWRIGVEYLGTGSVDYIQIEYSGSDPVDGANSIYSAFQYDAPLTEPVWKDYANRDLRMKVYV